MALSAPFAATNVPRACHSHANLHLGAVLRSADSRSGRNSGPVRSYRSPIGPHQHVPRALCVEWIGVASERGRRAALRHSTPHEHAQCRHGGERGSEVSLCCPRKDQFIQRQIRNGFAKPLVLFLQPLQSLQLVRAHSTVLLLPAVKRLFSHTNLADRIQARHSLPRQNLNLP